MSHARRRMAEQMERDEIRSMNRHEVGGRCAHTEPPYEGFVIGCKNPARYLVKGVGKRCFTHAAPFIGRNAT